MWPWPAAGPTPPTRSATPTATTATTRHGTRSAATATVSSAGWKPGFTEHIPWGRQRKNEVPVTTNAMTEGQTGGAGRDDSAAAYTSDEMMTVSAARALRDNVTCFVGIGLPSAAANLARATSAPGLVLIYESGTIGAKPGRLPLSIGDGILAQTADAVVSVPEIFNYWLQPGRIDVGFLGAAQIDKFGNINTTVIGGDYGNPKVRLPGAG